MFFSNLIQRKISSLLRPWLLQEPVCELKLGFLRSRIVFRNLRLDSAVLNALFDGGYDLRLLFKSVTVDEVVVDVSYCSAPAFIVDVRGFNVAIYIEKQAVAKRVDIPIDDYLKDRKRKILAQLDPQGSVLHDHIEKLATSASLKTGLKDSLMNLVLAHCCLHFYEARMQVEFPVSDDKISWLCYSRKLNAESTDKKIWCFLGGCIGLLFRPFRDTSFNLEASELEIGAEKKDDSSCILSCVNPYIGIKLRDLRLVNFLLSLPEMNFSFSPNQLLMMRAFYNLLYTECTLFRSGRMLWGIARFKIHNMLLRPKYILYKFVIAAVRWLRLVKEYQALLALVGYPEDGLKRVKNCNLSGAAYRQWQMISLKGEKELPAEAIARARRVARHRAALKVVCAEDVTVSPVISGLNSFWRIFLPIFVIWQAILTVYEIISRFVLHMTSLVVGRARMTSEVADLSCCFHLSIGKVSAIVSPLDAHTPRKTILKKGTSNLDLLSFLLVAKEFLFIYEEGVCEQHTSCSLGFLEITSGAVSHSSENGTRPRSSDGNSKDSLDGPKTIVWGESALKSCPSEEREVECGAIPSLKQLTDDMEMTWNRLRSRLQGNNSRYDGNPWAVCGVHTSLAYPGITNPDSGFLKCNLMVGKLNFELAYASLLSIATLVEQVQFALYQFDGFDNAMIQQRSRAFHHLLMINSPRTLRSHVERMKVKLFKLLPDIYVEVRAIVAGPRVQISLMNEGISGSFPTTNGPHVMDGVNFTIDVHNTDVAVWPTAMPGIVPNVEDQISPANSEFKLLENVANSFLGSGSIEYALRQKISLCYFLRHGGLNAYLENSLKTPMTQVLLLKPLTLKFSHIRDYLCSFGWSAVASSLSLCGSMSGATGLFYMDELSVISKVVENLVAASSSCGSGYAAFHAAQNHQVILKHQILHNEPVNEEIFGATDEETTMTPESDLFYIRASFELVPFDVIFHNSRNVSDKQYYSLMFDAYNIRSLGLAESADIGIWLSVQRTFLDISVGEAKAEVDTDFHGFRAVVFKYKTQSGNADESVAEIAALKSIDCLHEVSLSGCTFSLSLNCLIDPGLLIEDNSAMAYSNPMGLFNGLPSTTGSGILNCKNVKDEGFEPDVSASAPSHWLLMELTVGAIYIGCCSVKNDILQMHPLVKLQSSLSFGGGARRILVGIQGGIIIIEPSVLVRFAHCLTSYLDFVTMLLYMEHSSRKSTQTALPGDGVSTPGNEHSEESAQRNASAACFVEWELLESLSIDVSDFSLVLLESEESGLLREIVWRTAFSLKLFLGNRKQFLFDLSNLDIFSRILDGGMRQREQMNQVPHFSSAGSSYGSLWSNHENSTGSILHREKVFVFSEDASSSRPLGPMKNTSAKDAESSDIEVSGNCILERLVIVITAEKPFSLDENGQHCATQGWVGHGSISGLNLTISLSEIKLLMAVVDSFSEVYGEGGANSVEGTSWASIDHNSEIYWETALPDGAIVAIQDVHQHMYVTVEGVENRYQVASAVHYSVADRQALFRVKWQKQRRWKFSTSWFCLMSLYAKTNSGEPLCLSYCASSSFVDISSSTDSACALWKVGSHRHESYEDDFYLRPLNYLSKNTFYLVNKKSDCAIAFVHGAFEFVKKPGNPFKFKIIHGLSSPHGIVTSESHLLGSSDPVLLEGQNISDHAATVPSITLTIEKVSLSIVHELSDADDKLPLLQGSINSTKLTIQVLTEKTRVISRLTAMFHYFDASRTRWRELVKPIELCIYWRSKSHSQVVENSNHGMHSRLYVWVQELHISLTELSLDILLYLVGNLDLAGPFSVKSSVVSANGCKVINQLELDLLCHFYKAQSARVGKRQSAFFFLRQLMDQPLEASFATISLDIPGSSSTSSVLVPLTLTQVFAWRTRIKSVQDPQTYPGPFIVFDILKNAEEGVRLTISPLLRIHNKTGFPVVLRVQRAESMEIESASVLVREGDAVDDSLAAFDAVSLAGGPKKALLSLGVGNFVFSFKPNINNEDNSFCKSSSIDWSDNLEGGKAVRLSGVIDKFGYKVRKALSGNSWKYSFSSVVCSVISENVHVGKMHFLVQCIGRDIPLMPPTDHRKSKISSIALKEQKEIFLLPTVRVSNLVEGDIDVLLTETDNSLDSVLPNINQATVPFGLTADLYANPAVIFFSVKLTMFGCRCKPVNCGQWLKKLNKKKDGIQFLDIDLEFCQGQFFACLRLARTERGMLEAIVFTQYTLRNDTELPLFCATPNLKPSLGNEAERFTLTTSPHLGTYLPPKSTRSWFMRSRKMCVRLSEEQSAESILDLDVLSGLAEISFTRQQGSGFKQSVKLGISLGPLMSKVDVPARMVSIVPRYVMSNESDERILVRQCLLEDDSVEAVGISSKQKTSLSFRVGSHDKRDITVLDKLLRKHKVFGDDSSAFVQFRPDDTVSGWSGPVCVASFGRFFLKFKRSHVHQSDLVTREDDATWEYAVVHVVEEASTIVLRFNKPPDIGLPYRIENLLPDSSISYYQKDTFELETLSSRSSVYYVWDDVTRPHKLVVKINGTEMLREISLDKLRPWKPFLRNHWQRELPSNLPIDSRFSVRRGTNILMNGIHVEKLGYEVYADGPTRVLRICHSPESHKADGKFYSCNMIQLRVSHFAVWVLEPSKQGLLEDEDSNSISSHTPIVVGRLESISLDSIMIDQRKYNQIRVQSVDIDEKWSGAPYAAMLRRHLTPGNNTDDPILFVVVVLYPSSSDVREVKYSSIVLQPIDLNLDEGTLMKIVPFWRTSLSTNAQSQQYYFDHFEIHPVKIFASFLPEDSYSSYSSGQETLRSLLHSVIKIPAIKNQVVELNGVLVTHALVTMRELLLRCAQHYSWYAMRAIYIGKGSPLLLPTFASVFDDLASSSLDVFFDPSSSLFNVRGLTLGTFKLVSKCIENKGFSGTRRYFGDLSKTLKNASSNVLFAAVTEVTDSVLKGAESSGLNGMVTGFHHGILKLAMEPSFLGTAFLEGGPDRKIKLDRSPGVDELYIEGYLQAMLDTIYKQEYLRIRVIDDQVILKNLPPNSSLIDEIMDRVKDFLVSKDFLRRDNSSRSRPFRHLRGEKEWSIGPTVLTLCEHLFVSFAIRTLRKQTSTAIDRLKLKGNWASTERSTSSSSEGATAGEAKGKFIWRWGIGKFVLSALVAYVDGRLCRCIPNPVARRIVSGFLLSFLDNNDSK